MKILTVFVLGWAVMVLARAEESSDLVKRSPFCQRGWTRIRSACFRYVPRPMTWAIAESNCRSMGAHLASVQSIGEYHKIQKMIADATHDYRETWLGGSDAQHENVWLWTNGEHFKFSNWCPGEPSNFIGWQHCLQMNFSGQKCWDDLGCYHYLPSVCKKKRGRKG